MSTETQNKTTLPLPPILMAIDTAALVLVALCLAELFSKSGKVPGIIPEPFIWPALVGSGLIAAICSFQQIKMLLARKKTSSGTDIEKL